MVMHSLGNQGTTHQQPRHPILASTQSCSPIPFPQALGWNPGVLASNPKPCKMPGGGDWEQELPA